MLPFLTWSIKRAALCLPRLPHPPGSVLVAQLCLTLCDPWTIAHKLLCPWDSPGKNTGVRSHSLLRGSSRPRDQTPSPTLKADSLPYEPPGSPLQVRCISNKLLKYSVLFFVSLSLPVVFVCISLASRQEASQEWCLCLYCFPGVFPLLFSGSD